MNYLDIIIAILLILFAIGGFRNGIIREAFSLVAFAVGIYGAIKLSDIVGKWLGNLINVSPEWMSVISFIIVFIALALLINWLGGLIAGLIEKLNLGFIDKIGGIVFGVAKGFLLVGVCILLLDFFGIKDVLNKETCEKSVLYKQSEKVATWIYENKDGWIEKIDKVI
ncbi:MAG: CvpA family protein [Bacteroidales bacterium]|nr:CvpA family protein [Bacteroidales bacterium]